jgi:hypothetical protein
MSLHGHIRERQAFLLQFPVHRGHAVDLPDSNVSPWACVRRLTGGLAGQLPSLVLVWRGFTLLKTNHCKVNR